MSHLTKFVRFRSWRTFYKKTGSKIGKWLKRIILFLAFLVLLTGSSPPVGDHLERIRFFTRSIEFDFITWTVNAVIVKFDQAVLGTNQFVKEVDRPGIVLDYLDLLRQIQVVEAEIAVIYTDPEVDDPSTVSAFNRQTLQELIARRSLLEPLAEAVLQDQVSRIVSEMGFSLAGQNIPPVLYHTTPPPNALVISPRDIIRQDYNISIIPELSLDELVDLEEKVDQAMDVSSLVVGIGGIGLYPTMVMETTDINLLAEVVSHEWIHNYLTLRPLGLHYLASPELRTMNETAASIAGKELGSLLVERYYPELLPSPPPEIEERPVEQPRNEETPPVFDFRAEMRLTRVSVDEMLADGKIKEAEVYMEQRRQFLWENGYRIRKLNQAFFAFYGAYADDPAGGAAGKDLVGTAVRTLRSQSSSLKDFIRRIAWMDSFEQLQQAVDSHETGARIGSVWGQ